MWFIADDFRCCCCLSIDFRWRFNFRWYSMHFLTIIVHGLGNGLFADSSFSLGIVRSALCLLWRFGAISDSFATFATSFPLHVVRLALGSLSDVFATVGSSSVLDDSLWIDYFLNIVINGNINIKINIIEIILCFLRSLFVTLAMAIL